MNLSNKKSIHVKNKAMTYTVTMIPVTTAITQIEFEMQCNKIY